MKKSSVNYRGMKFEAMKCPKCNEKIFTEDLAMKAISTLEAERLKEEYIKKPIKIGHSWGITFPKEIADVFNLKKRKLKLHPDVENQKIEISLY